MKDNEKMEEQDLEVSFFYREKENKKKIRFISLMYRNAFKFCLRGLFLKYLINLQVKKKKDKKSPISLKHYHTVEG